MTSVPQTRTWNLLTGALIDHTIGASDTFNNFGTVNMLGSGTTFDSNFFNNSGTTNVQTGTLDLQ